LRPRISCLRFVDSHGQPFNNEEIAQSAKSGQRRHLPVQKAKPIIFPEAELDGAAIFPSRAGSGLKNNRWRKEVKEAKIAKPFFAANLISDQYREDWVLAELRREFSRNDYVKLPALVDSETLAKLKVEIDLLEKFAHNKNFMMEVSKYGTPRIMTTLGGETIMQELPRLGLDRVALLGTLYTHHEIWALLQSIIGARIYSCLHPNEFMVMNYLVGRGNTHGWHLDDPAYALIIFIESPPTKEEGGLIEYIQDWNDIYERETNSGKESVEAIIERCREKGAVKTLFHVPGDAYLLRADQCLHRVTPLVAEDARRVALNLGFESKPSPVYGATATLLYS
jgi:hypothetical protein